MHYSLKTSLKEYQQWLDTNPSMAEIAAVAKRARQLAVNICDRIRLTFTKKRSCLAPMGVKTTYPLSYNKNAIGTTQGKGNFIFWKAYLPVELALTTNHIVNMMKLESLQEEIWSFEQDNARLKQALSTIN